MRKIRSKWWGFGRSDIETFSWRTAVKGIGIVVIVSAITGSIWYWYDLRNREEPLQPASRCSLTLLSEARPVIASQNVDDLQRVATKVENIADYNQDINCLYVTLSYYLAAGDSVRARQEFDDLEGLYNDRGFAANLGENIQSIDSLRQNVEFLEVQQKDIQQRSYLGGSERQE